MAIATAVVRGSTVYMYDEKGQTLGTTPVANGLHGFTSTTVSILRGSAIYFYDEKGQPTGSTPA